MHPETARATRDPDRGSAVIEAALVIPVLLAVTVLFVWVASLGATYVRLLEVAQTAARQVARGVPSPDTAPGIDLAVSEQDGLIRVEASERVTPPLVAFIDWGMTVSAQAHSVPEWGAWEGGGVEPEVGRW